MRSAVLIFCGLSLVACDRRLEADAFQRRAEQIFVDVNSGFGIAKREGLKTTFVRADQTYLLDLEPHFTKYQAEKTPTGAFFDQFETRLGEEAAARRRTVDQALTEILPFVKGGSWIRLQDLGAIGPERMQASIRPWRKELAPDLYVVLGVPEELVGFRYVSIAEMASQSEPERLLARAVENLTRTVGAQVLTATAGVELRGPDRALWVLDLLNVDGVSGLILDPRFRTKMLERFGVDELGAAIPSRDVLILFEPGDFTRSKPIRARTHQLYDGRNHPAHRELLRFDRDRISAFETPKEK